MVCFKIVRTTLNLKGISVFVIVYVLIRKAFFAKVLNRLSISLVLKIFDVASVLEGRFP